MIHDMVVFGLQKVACDRKQHLQINKCVLWSPKIGRGASDSLRLTSSGESCPAENG